MGRLKTIRQHKSLSLLFPVHRTITSRLAHTKLFEGMLLHLKVLEASHTIAIAAWYDGDAHIVGVLPKGMLPHILPVLEEEDKYLVQLVSPSCERLEERMWISLDELPSLERLGLTGL